MEIPYNQKGFSRLSLLLKGLYLRYASAQWPFLRVFHCRGCTGWEMRWVLQPEEIGLWN